MYRRDILRKVLGIARPQHREVLNLRLVEGKSKHEVARELGVSPDEATDRLMDAVLALRVDVPSRLCKMAERTRRARS